MKSYKISLVTSLALTAISLLFVLFNSSYTLTDFGRGIQHYCSAEVWQGKSFGENNSPHYFPVKTVTAPEGLHGEADLRVGVAHAKVFAVVVSPDLLPLMFLLSWITTAGIGVVSHAIGRIRSWRSTPSGSSEVHPALIKS